MRNHNNNSGHLCFIEGIDDNGGDRTVEAIANVHGIVTFYASYGDMNGSLPSDMACLGREEKYTVRTLNRQTWVMRLYA